MLLFDVSDAREVRAAIGTQVTSADVPDDIVMLDIYAGLASDRVLEWRDALAPTLGSDDPRLRRAAIYLTAAFIAPTVPHLLSERTPDYQYQQQALPDPTARVSQLEQEAFNAVVLAAGPNAVMPALDVFDSADGYRGWVRPRAFVTEADLPGQLFG